MASTEQPPADLRPPNPRDRELVSAPERPQKARDGTSAGASERPPEPRHDTSVSTRERPPKLREGEFISAIGALLLLIFMFAFKWFGLATTPSPSAERAARSSAEDAWNGLTLVRWLMLLTILVALGSVALHARQRSHPVKTDTSRAIAAFGTLTAALLAYRVLIDLPSPRDVVDQKLGAYLGLLAALAIAFGGYEAIREERVRERQRAQRANRRVPPHSDTLVS